MGVLLPEVVGYLDNLLQPQRFSDYCPNALHIGDAAASVRKVAWCTGAAQGYIEQAVKAGAELFISGEVSEQTVPDAVRRRSGPFWCCRLQFRFSLRSYLVQPEFLV